AARPLLHAAVRHVDPAAPLFGADTELAACAALPARPLHADCLGTRQVRQDQPPGTKDVLAVVATRGERAICSLPSLNEGGNASEGPGTNTSPHGAGPGQRKMRSVLHLVRMRINAAPSATGNDCGRRSVAPLERPGAGTNAHPRAGYFPRSCRASAE